MFKDEFHESEWTRRNVAEEPRLSELVNLYEELGFEVYLKDVTVEECPAEECSSCLMANPEKYKIIYTKETI